MNRKILLLTCFLMLATSIFLFLKKKDNQLLKNNISHLSESKVKEIFNSVIELEKDDFSREPIYDPGIYFNQLMISPYYSNGNLQSLLFIWNGPHRLSNYELLWWRTESRELRLLILGIYYSKLGSDVDVSGYPDFYGYASRFTPEESKYRKEELDFILENIEDIKKIMNNFF